MILVVGATGDLGGRVVRLLRRQGEQVRCLVRPASDDSELRALGASIAPGDLTEPASLRDASAGVDTVIASATAIGRELSGMRTPTSMGPECSRSSGPPSRQASSGSSSSPTPARPQDWVRRWSVRRSR